MHKINRDANTYYLYRHLTLDSSIPFYVGIGMKRKLHSATIESEYERAYVTTTRNNFWKHIVNKHGRIVEILMETSNKDLIYNKEKEFIKLYGRRDNNTGILCNLTDGGENFLNLSEEAEKNRRIKISKALTLRVRKVETCIKISEAKYKPIYKCDKYFNILEEFSSITEAAKSINLTISSISKCLKNGKYTAGSYKWKYKSI